MIPSAFLIAGTALFYASKYFPYLTIFISLTLITYLFSKKQSIAAIFFIFGVLYAFFRYTEAPAFKYAESVAATGYFTSPAEKTKEGFSREFKAESPFRGRLTVYSEERLEPGRRYRLALKIYTPDERLNPGHVERRPYGVMTAVLEEGELIASPSAFLSRSREKIKAFFDGSFEKDSAAFISALTVGTRTGFTPGLVDAFSRTGLAHLLSISGTHFGLFFLILFFAIKSLIKYLPLKALEKITLYVTPPQAAALFAMPLMLTYLGISGASVPSIRAFIMISLFLTGLLIGRKGFWLNSLLIAAVILVLWEPEVILDLSFELSFLAVLFIGTVTEDEKRTVTEGEIAKSGKKRKAVVYLRKSFIISLAVTAGVAPLVAYHFNYFSLLSPLANMIVTPIVGFLLVPLSLVGSLLFVLTGHFFLVPAVDAVSRLSLGLVKALSEIPYCSINVASFPIFYLLFFYSGLLLWAAYKWKRDYPSEIPIPHLNRYFLRYGYLLPSAPLFIFVLFSVPHAGPLTVTFLDVGHADSSLIETPDGKLIAVDTGKTGKEITGHIKRMGRGVVDVLILTHAHEDHTGGLGHISERLQIKEVWDNGSVKYPEGFLDDKTHRTLKRGDAIEGEGYRLLFLHPYEGFRYANAPNENEESLVFKLEGGKIKILFAADIELNAEEDLSNLGSRLKSDVFKVPHHGGLSSAHEVFIKTVSPRVSVVTSWRRPAGRMKDALYGSRVFCTGVDGAVKIGDDGRIETYSEDAFEKARSLRDEVNNIKRLFTSW